MNIISNISTMKSSTWRQISKFGFAFLLLFAVSFIAVCAETAGDEARTNHGCVHAGLCGSEDIVSHVNGMLNYIYSEVGASEAQKSKLAEISQQATNDLVPLHQQIEHAHTQVFTLLTQASIDRTAIETARVEQMRAVDQASKRATQFVADVAAALTPAQRKALADHFAQHMS
jgi:periplasmic protein CpxP/Spy